MKPQTDSPCRHLRLCLWLVAAFRHLVPRRLRADWSQEWKAELVHHFQTLERDALAVGRLPDRRMPRPPGPWEILLRTLGAFWHALWLRRQEWSVDTMFQDLRFAA